MALGVPTGPLFGRLQHGQTVEVDGKIIRPDQVMGEPRLGERSFIQAIQGPANQSSLRAITQIY